MKREFRRTFWGVAAVLVAYIGFVCIVKNHSAAMVWVAAAAAALGGGALEIAVHFVNN